MFRRLLLTTIIAWFCIPHLMATAQIGDVLIVDGKKYSINTDPLRPYLETHPDALPERQVVSTANWRGYVATWEAKNGALFLKDVEMERAKASHEFEYYSVMATIFPGRSEVVADWFSGNIIVVTGKLKKYVHMGYASTYDGYLVLKVDKGGILSQAKMDQKGFQAFRDQQFRAFQKTEKFQKALAEAMADKDAGDRAQEIEFLKQFYSGEYLSAIYPD